MLRFFHLQWQIHRIRIQIKADNWRWEKTGIHLQLQITGNQHKSTESRNQDGSIWNPVALCFSVRSVKLDRMIPHILATFSCKQVTISANWLKVVIANKRRQRIAYWEISEGEVCQAHLSCHSTICRTAFPGTSCSRTAHWKHKATMSSYFCLHPQKPGWVRITHCISTNCKTV